MGGEPLCLSNWKPRANGALTCCPTWPPLGRSEAVTWSLEGFHIPLLSLLCPGRGWNFFLLTSDNSEPYFPEEAEEEWGAGRPSRSQLLGVAGCVTGISCPLLNLPLPHFPGAKLLPQACWWPPWGAIPVLSGGQLVDRTGLAPGPCEWSRLGLVAAWAWPLHTHPAVVRGSCSCLFSFTLA